MAKTKDADTSFRLGKWHLAQVLRARWASLPGVGTDAPPVLVLQIKLSIPYYWPFGLTGKELDETTLELISRAAVIYIPCTKDRAPLTEAGSLFLHALEVQREATRDNLDHSQDWFKCEFGPADPIYGYQSLVDWASADANSVITAAQRALRAVTSQQVPALGLNFPQPGIATRTAQVSGKVVVTELDFTECPIGWFVLKRLAHRHPRHYPLRDLGYDAWREAGQRIPRGIKAAVYSTVYHLRATLRPCGLDLPRATAKGYLLKETGIPGPDQIG